MKTSDTSVEVGTLTAFLTDGDVGHLLPLADHFAETGRDEMSATVHRVIADEVSAKAVRFFATHAGYSYGAETVEWARFRCGVELAEAEAWFQVRETADWSPEPGSLSFQWEPDADYFADDEEGEDAPGIGWSCLLVRLNDDNSVDVVQSLHGITFAGDGYPDGQDYKRVVEAELASEQRDEMED